MSMDGINSVKKHSTLNTADIVQQQTQSNEAESVLNFTKDNTNNKVPNSCDDSEIMDIISEEVQKKKMN